MKTKYEIELPTAPDGLEVVGVAEIQEGDSILRHNDVTGECAWVDARGQWGGFGLVARRKRTLADWANEQPLFKALAEMRSMHENPTNICHIGLTLWAIRNESFNLGTPPTGLNGKLTLKNGKWEDAT